MVKGASDLPKAKSLREHDFSIFVDVPSSNMCPDSRQLAKFRALDFVLDSSPSALSLDIRLLSR
jgi:hypothetical protein